VDKPTLQVYPHLQRFGASEGPHALSVSPDIAFGDRGSCSALQQTVHIKRAFGSVPRQFNNSPTRHNLL
jgi:hypothetical protein